jgi:hypothetical protein
MEEKMLRKPAHLISLLSLLILTLSLASPSRGAPQEVSVLTGYYNLLGYEGIGTLGVGLQDNGPTPPVADYVTTHCRYIDVPNTVPEEYYLRYPLHLPNNATIIQVDLHVADFNPSGVMRAGLYSRPWNSRNPGTALGLTSTSAQPESDLTVTIPGLNVEVNNHLTQYWIDVSPANSAEPGQLCVYGIQVTYTYDGSFLPMIRKGG